MMRLTFSFEVRQWILNEEMQKEAKLGSLSCPTKTTKKEDAVLARKRQRDAEEKEVNERRKRAKKDLERRWEGVKDLMQKMLETKEGKNK